jgi:hypothetical protein
MADIERVGVDEARRRVKSGEALLVCAYDDEEKCRRMGLEGAISLAGLRSRVPTLSKQQELIFYCA